MAMNADLAAKFEQIAQLLQLTGADPFRVNAHAKAARVIADYPGDLAAIAHDKKALTAIEGVGARTADKIAEFADTGRIGELDELLEQVPQGLLAVLEVPGVGPKTAQALWKELGVETLDDLKRVIEDGSILNLPRMGAKTVENIRQSIAFQAQSGERTALGVAAPIAEGIVERLHGVKGAQAVGFAGSLRRGCETIGDIDILASGTDPDALREAFLTMPGVEQVLASGETKSSVRLRVQDRTGKARLMQADLRLMPKDRFGAALHYFTGSKAHNVRLRERALKQGMTLNEWGLFEDDGGKTPPQERGAKPVAAATEEAIFEALGVPYLPPEVREDRGELGLKATPRLVAVEDIKAELHAHTTASDGLLSIEELAQEAKRRGFHTIAVTDHSKSQPVANGLSVERLREHVAAIREVNERLGGITVLAGSEVDIHADGRLDYEDEDLALLDIVVASPHWALTQDPKKATARLLRAVAHPLVDILGHPTGRLIGRRAGLSPAMDEVIAAAKQHKVALEVNAHWMRLDLRDTHVRAAVEAGALVAINCDVHATEDYDNLRYGVVTARRGWLTPERCVNTWTAKKLHGWLKAKRG